MARRQSAPADSNITTGGAGAEFFNSLSQERPVTWYLTSIRRTGRDLVIAGLVFRAVVIPRFISLILGPMI